MPIDVSALTHGFNLPWPASPRSLTVIGFVGACCKLRRLSIGRYLAPRHPLNTVWLGLACSRGKYRRGTGRLAATARALARLPQSAENDAVRSRAIGAGSIATVHKSGEAALELAPFSELLSDLGEMRKRKIARFPARLIAILQQL